MSFTSFPLNLLLRPKPVSHLITIPIYLILPYFQFHMQISFANIPNLNVPCYSEGTEIRLIPPTILRRASKLFYNFFSQHELLPDTLNWDKKRNRYIELRQKETLNRDKNKQVQISVIITPRIHDSSSSVTKKTHYPTNNTLSHILGPGGHLDF